jgi:hypothetical protein
LRSQPAEDRKSCTEYDEHYVRLDMYWSGRANLYCKYSPENMLFTYSFLVKKEFVQIISYTLLTIRDLLVIGQWNKNTKPQLNSIENKYKTFLIY